MGKNFKEAIQNCRTYYSLNNQISVSDEEIKEVINHAVKHVPSAFNSQTTRVILLLGKQHQQLWSIVTETLRAIVSTELFSKTEDKIKHAFASGYGTVLFFEDQEVVESLQEAFPSYSDNFPGWSIQTSAMHQFAIWTMLEALGLGASLQHYNPLIDEEVRKTWNLDPKWKLIAQMPFGNPTGKPGEKEFEPLEKRVKIFE
ncbi:nitroreductase family protein [Dysgonomonas sp. 25]|uniref:nitroreductase family protein n=1 Tax=Dysgonomonas sp. 25 TaxID=2302933 RepID=UPI0013D7EB9B|nr:nitroreductase family protein [Dysgonomonas sp. 25]NDV69672.1 nitroreductase family protein [Dysgonomonas sp. 25]